MIDEVKVVAYKKSRILKKKKMPIMQRFKHMLDFQRRNFGITKES